MNTQLTEITVMADFSSSGLWVSNQGHMIEYEDLNLSKELINEFENWIEFYDCKCHTPDLTFKSEMAKEFNTIGKELAKKLKKLFPNMKIIYKGETDSGMLNGEEVLNISH
jgi:hypothetical protein